MQRALELASFGAGSVSPNPMVGCVIVHEDAIIGEGYHQRIGEPHAEVNAIRSVRNKDKLKQSRLYVTLEPCSHHGRTPPCADLILEYHIPEVVVAMMDPNDKVNGQGISRLKSSGVMVKTGVCEREAKYLNRRFITYHQKKRPYIILKWAETADGFIARSNYDSKWISNEYSRQLVHKWRAEEDAILVGWNTVNADNPMLNVRDWQGEDPVRIVLGAKKTISKYFLGEGTHDTLLFSEDMGEAINKTEWIQLSVDTGLENVMLVLKERGIQSVIVEGGTNTIQRFVDKGLWDEARVFISKTNFQSGIQSPGIPTHPVQEIALGDDMLFIHQNFQL
jgi:diaminohydroxyphosphoribosylaminopyrimidine deaminase/5-amino-6-(5-phosphoribosylamino)uracil reductase